MSEEEFIDPFENEGNMDMDMDIDDFNAFEKPELVENNRYWKKDDNSTSVELWNEYYGKYFSKYGYNELPIAYFDNVNNTAYYPNLGEKIEGHPNCRDICMYIQNKLLKQGYFHTDLYLDNYYNCNNIVMNEKKFYCPIDFIKMIKLENLRKDQNIISDLKNKGIESDYFNEEFLGINNFFKKYLKYKKKYLELKNKFNVS